MLTEEVVHGAEGRAMAGARCARSEGAVGNYAAAAQREHQARVTDLVPRRPLAYALLVGFGGAIVGGLIGLYARAAGNGDTPAVSELLDLQQSGSLAAWFSSLVLLLVAALSLLLYSLRRHKQSDYHGRYRVWLWTALASMGMSLCATSPVHLHAAQWLAGRTGWQLPGGTLLFWLVPVGLFLGIIGVRLVLEVRGSRLSLLFIVLAAAAYVAAWSAPHIGRIAATPMHAVLVGAGGQLAAHLLLLLGVMLFARHVLLDIEGLLPAREEPSSEKKQSESKAPSSAAAYEKVGAKLDPPHPTPPAPAGRTDLESEMATARRLREEAELEQEWYESRPDGKRNRHPERSEQREEDEDEDHQPQGRKLSKADRKRLRRLKAQQRDGGY